MFLCLHEYHVSGTYTDNKKEWVSDVFINMDLVSTFKPSDNDRQKTVIRTDRTILVSHSVEDIMAMLKYGQLNNSPYVYDII